MLPVIPIAFYHMYTIMLFISIYRKALLILSMAQSLHPITLQLFHTLFMADTATAAHNAIMQTDANTTMLLIL